MKEGHVCGTRCVAATVADDMRLGKVEAASCYAHGRMGFLPNGNAFCSECDVEWELRAVGKLKGARP